MNPSPAPKLAIAALASLSLLGCAPKPAVKPTPDAAATAPGKSTTAAPQTASNEGQDARGADDSGNEALQTPPLYFALDSATLQPESQEALTRLAEGVRRQRAARLKIEGHTCELGTAEYNLALGLRRAQVTRDYLVRLGLDASAIEIVSFGEEHPAVDEQTEEAHARNRRSEVQVSLQEHTRR